jgi:hypothetical protein
MPMLDQATDIMSQKFSASNINQAVADAPLFAALPLPASYVYPAPNQAMRRQMLQAYLDALPPGIQENIRATIYFALTSRPPRPMKFRWAGAYDYKLEFVETYDTYYSPRTPGVISLTLHGRYPDDPHPLSDRMKPQERRASTSRRSATGSPKPAKRKASKRS